MKRTVEFEYDIGDEVEVRHIDATGTVISLWVSDIGVQYQVRYWSNADHKTEYMLPKEITAKEPK